MVNAVFSELPPILIPGLPCNISAFREVPKGTVVWNVLLSSEEDIWQAGLRKPDRTLAWAPAIQGRDNAYRNLNQLIRVLYQLD